MSRLERTLPCGREEARLRVSQARRYLALAEAGSAERAVEGSTNVAFGNAALAGIAAADAITCISSGLRSSATDHRATGVLLAEALGRTDRAVATAFGRLIDLKGDAHYSARPLPPAKTDAALRHARTLVDFAERLLSG